MAETLASLRAERDRLLREVERLRAENARLRGRSEGVTAPPVGIAPSVAEINRRDALRRDARVRPLILPLRRRGIGMADIAEILSERRVPAARGGDWHKTSVARTLGRLEEIGQGLRDHGLELRAEERAALKIFKFDPDTFEIKPGADARERLEIYQRLQDAVVEGPERFREAWLLAHRTDSPAWLAFKEERAARRARAEAQHLLLDVMARLSWDFETALPEPADYDFPREGVDLRRRIAAARKVTGFEEPGFEAGSVICYTDDPEHARLHYYKARVESVRGGRVRARAVDDCEALGVRRGAPLLLLSSQALGARILKRGS